MKPALISWILALLRLLCRPRVTALQAPCSHRGLLLPRKAQSNASPGHRRIATPLARAEAERSTNSVANRKRERTARGSKVLSGGLAAPSASVVQIIPGLKRFPR